MNANIKKKRRNRSYKIGGPRFVTSRCASVINSSQNSSLTRSILSASQNDANKRLLSTIRKVRNNNKTLAQSLANLRMQLMLKDNQLLDAKGRNLDLQMQIAACTLSYREKIKTINVYLEKNFFFLKEQSKALQNTRLLFEDDFDLIDEPDNCNKSDPLMSCDQEVVTERIPQINCREPIFGLENIEEEPECENIEEEPECENIEKEPECENSEPDFSKNDDDLLDGGQNEGENMESYVPTSITPAKNSFVYVTKRNKNKIFVVPDDQANYNAIPENNFESDVRFSPRAYKFFASKSKKNLDDEDDAALEEDQLYSSIYNESKIEELSLNKENLGDVQTKNSKKKGRGRKKKIKIEAAFNESRIEESCLNNENKDDGKTNKLIKLKKEKVDDEKTIKIEASSSFMDQSQNEQELLNQDIRRSSRKRIHKILTEPSLNCKMRR